MLDTSILDSIRRLPIVVEFAAVFDTVVDCAGEIVFVTLASSRLGLASTGFSLRSTALSQQLATLIPRVSLQQKMGVAEPLMSGHGTMALKTFKATITSSTPAQGLLGKQLGMIDSIPFLQLGQHLSASQLISVQPPRYVYPAVPKQ